MAYVSVTKLSPNDWLSKRGPVFLKLSRQTTRRIEPVVDVATQVEVAQLRSRVQELEAEIAELTVLADGLGEELEAATAEVTRRSSAFQAAWSEREPNMESDRFFEQGAIDQRARRWLLKESK